MKKNLTWFTLIGFAGVHLVMYAILKDGDFFISANIFLAAAFLAIKEQ